MKVKLIANLNIDEVVDCDDSMTEDEIYEDLWDYMCQKIDWHWKEVDDERV